MYASCPQMTSVRATRLSLLPHPLQVRYSFCIVLRWLALLRLLQTQWSDTVLSAVQIAVQSSAESCLDLKLHAALQGFDG